MSLTLALAEDQTIYRPGETLAGVAAWQLDERPRSVDLRLFWYTRGKGDEDITVVQELSIEHPARQGRKRFTMQLPQAPYSFSGRLISLIWAVELVAGGQSELVELVLAPFGQEVDLTRNAPAAD